MTQAIQDELGRDMRDVTKRTDRIERKLESIERTVERILATRAIHVEPANTINTPYRNGACHLIARADAKASDASQNGPMAKDKQQG